MIPSPKHLQARTSGLRQGGDGQVSGALSLAGSADTDSMGTRADSSGEACDSQQRVTLHPPPCTVIRRVQSENVQLLLRLLRVAAQEAIPVLVQIVDQIPIEAVLGDDVNRACGNRKQLRNRHKTEEQKCHEMLCLPRHERILKTRASNDSVEVRQLRSGDLYLLACLEVES